MNRTAAAKAVRKLLRDTALRGSPREFSAETRLGDGLGLDSLAVVEFVLAFEKKFRVQVPEHVWSRWANLTLTDFVDLLADKH